MSNIKDILLEMQELRKHLNDLVKQKNNLLNPEVIAASKMLDSLLNEYSRIIKNKVDK
ncbi:MAG: aspartyl-phosphate phosphatase Spo0E family protein [Clostridium sp.]|jgi:hypothetical protein|uniref:aspartyl-phosphate phosphatase Spo0E family protein n=1 Tax=Clostridium sp. TaxID=1506 RepID=UPI0025BDEE8A|nr:aspartyl-phosphate phosphatase Spo0E family protein [Clostridium sp.]MCH3965146.1 aspartyl-phosphate phosphatase Spo0E family protein [Clostridium sp.]MCI1714367.1 aspartyl-phosphate phosphatase Spo0E family protein [Clostridium sp.]MCI1798629.1 aspartyl-phosphate phosphatase Spo0E family protein [Clostridium sp.]MCI1812640.1 aspartyl-phosphate phosphatase Spo0E family protein [Clostridium sp.]MCI1869438.1 aspartyl-phosphate phosphatase Spo0E family protein [Clostridium sp.]